MMNKDNNHYTKLIKFITPLASFTKADLVKIQSVFIPVEIEPKITFLKTGQTALYVYFLSKGIVKGYKNLDGKIIVEHLSEQNNFFSSFESFNSDSPSLYTFETITKCEVLKITKPDLELLGSTVKNWNKLVEGITNHYLNRKMERIGEFQSLSAKERYMKFMEQHPHLALNVSIDNIASYLGMEPQSLSRIRKQITF